MIHDYDGCLQPPILGVDMSVTRAGHAVECGTVYGLEHQIQENSSLPLKKLEDKITNENLLRY